MSRPRPDNPGIQRLLEVLAVSPCTFLQAARAANLGDSGARDKLDWLVAEGRVVRERVDSGLGRPRIVYRLLPGKTTASASPARTRPCLCCGKTFYSQGFGNRLCNRCRAQDVSPFAIAN
jgi:hypothetical protein